MASPVFVVFALSCTFTAVIYIFMRNSSMRGSRVKKGIFCLCFCGFCTAMYLYHIRLHLFEYPEYLFPQFQCLFAKEDSRPLHQSLTDKRLDELFSFIDQHIGDVPFVYFKQTSSARKSIATILNPRASFCVGDTLVVRVEMFNHLGERKRWGGDYLHARIHSPNLGAAASGRVEDFNNGSYNVYFTLSWEGKVHISISLYHPSEGVSALWKIRKAEYNYLIFTGYFLNNGHEFNTECGLHLDSGGQEICEYSDEKYGEYFYCYKPQGVPCEAFSSLKASERPISYLTYAEKRLFRRSNIAVNISKAMGTIEVQKCTKTPPKIEAKCKTGERFQFPSGYFFKNQWHPINCKSNLTGKLDEAKKCLSGKLVYLIGDSTLRQWIMHFPKMLNELQFFDLHGKGGHQTYLLLDPKSNIYIQWRKHGHPFISYYPYTVKDLSYAMNDIDRLAGGNHTVIVITLGLHFRSFPLRIFIRRLLNLRQALERLFIRSPDTKVIIKTGNTRDIDPDVGRFSDFHGYIQYLLLKKILSGLDIGLIDAWDMTIATGSYQVHPSDSVVESQIYWLLSYIC